MLSLGYYLWLEEHALRLWLFLEALTPQLVVVGFSVAAARVLTVDICDFVEVIVGSLDELDLVLDLELALEISATLGILSRRLGFIALCRRPGLLETSAFFVELRSGDAWTKPAYSPLLIGTTVNRWLGRGHHTSTSLTCISHSAVHQIVLRSTI